MKRILVLALPPIFLSGCALFRPADDKSLVGVTRHYNALVTIAKSDGNKETKGTTFSCTTVYPSCT